MKIEMNSDMMSIMVSDWIADNAPEMDDLVLEGEPYYSEDYEAWAQDAHDEKGDYVLIANGGFIEIH